MGVIDLPLYIQSLVVRASNLSWVHNATSSVMDLVLSFSNYGMIGRMQSTCISACSRIHFLALRIIDRLGDITKYKL